MDRKLDAGGLAGLGNNVVDRAHSHRPTAQGSEYVDGYLILLAHPRAQCSEFAPFEEGGSRVSRFCAAQGEAPPGLRSPIIRNTIRTSSRGFSSDMRAAPNYARSIR